MRTALVVGMVAAGLFTAAGCGSSDKADGGGGFTERDRQAANQFVRLQEESPALDSLPDGIIYYFEHDSLKRSQATLRKLRRAARRSRRLVARFDDRRARRAMTDFAEGSDDVASAYVQLVRSIKKKSLFKDPKKSLQKFDVALRELEAAVDATNRAERRLSNLEAPG